MRELFVCGFVIIVLVLLFLFVMGGNGFRRFIMVFFNIKIVLINICFFWFVRKDDFMELKYFEVVVSKFYIVYFVIDGGFRVFFFLEGLVFWS